MTDAEIVGALVAHLEGLFPRTCSCGRRYASLGEYVRETEPHGDAISYDAVDGDWAPTRPLGALALANCRCGTTLALTTNGMPLATVHRVLAWIKAEMARRGVTSEVVTGDLREEIRKRALAQSARPSGQG
jgi:hypothetical protein